MPDSAAILPKRKRGGQPGNTNRLRHGRFSAATIARHAQSRRAIARDSALIIRVEMILRMRHAWEQKRIRTLSSPAIAGEEKRSGNFLQARRHQPAYGA